MFSPCQIERPMSTFQLYRLHVVALLGGLIFMGSACFANAQEAPPGAVGRIEGNDISVDSGTPASIASAMASPSMFVANGGVITVHSGQARLMLASGGQID